MKYSSKQETDAINNFKILQSAFKKLNVDQVKKHLFMSLSLSMVTGVLKSKDPPDRHLLILASFRVLRLTSW